jgi:hypothetical protein
VVIRHEHSFQLTDLCRCFAEPSQNRIFLMTGRARHTADAVAFGQLSERFDNLVCGCLASIKQCPFRRRECVATGPALIALLPIVGASKLDNVSLKGGLRLPVISALWIGAELARSD